MADGARLGQAGGGYVEGETVHRAAVGRAGRCGLAVGGTRGPHHPDHLMAQVVAPIFGAHAHDLI